MLIDTLSALSCRLCRVQIGSVVSKSGRQAHALVAPAPSSIAAVMAFLQDHGVDGVRATPNGDIIEVSAVPTEIWTLDSFIFLTFGCGRETGIKRWSGRNRKCGNPKSD